MENNKNISASSIRKTQNNNISTFSEYNRGDDKTDGILKEIWNNNAKN